MPGNTLSKLLHTKTSMILVYCTALALLALASADVYQRYHQVLTLKSDISSAQQPVKSTTSDRPTVIVTHQISSQYLFVKKTTKAKLAPQVIDAPITRLKLTLIGVLAADDPEKSKAIIQIDNKQVEVFNIGDKVPKTNAEIHQIQPLKVFLMRNGKLEWLAISRSELDMGNPEDEKQIVNGNGRSGANLMVPAQATVSRDKRPSASRTAPGSNAYIDADKPVYPPPPFEMPNFQRPPKR